MHHHAAAATDAWTTFGPFIGVLVGALIGGVAQVVNSRLLHRQQRFRDTAALRRAEYFDAIDAAYKMRLRLHDYASANSGRWQPEDVDHSPEAEEMRVRDVISAAALDELLLASNELGRLTIRVSAVGSETVRAAMDDLDASAKTYIQETIDDGMYRGARYLEFRDEYAKKLETLAAAVRADLEIDRVYQPKK